MKTITITLPTGIDEQAATQALAEGITLEDYLPRLIESALPHRQPQKHQNGLPLDEWLALLHQAPYGDTAKSANGATSSTITREDLRRENMYEDRR